MNEQHQIIIEKLNNMLKEFNNITTIPEQNDVEICIKEIYSEINSLNEDENPYLSHNIVLKCLYDLADIVCGFAEIFEDKFPHPLNALNFRNMELKIAKQYKASGGKKFWRNVWEIYLDISRHYSSLNIDTKSLKNAKTALKLLQKSESNPDPRDLSFIYRIIAFAYQDIAPDKSILYFNKSSDTLMEFNKTNESYENLLDIAINNINIAILMYEINQLYDAISTLKNCFALFENINSRYGDNKSNNYYLAIIYGVMAKSYFESSDYDEAIKSAEQGIILYNKSEENNCLASCEVADLLYSVMSLTLRNQENYMKAIEMLYKLLSIWMRQEESFIRSCRTSDIYVDISIIYSKYLKEQNLALEVARLSIREIKPYFSSNLFISNKKALSTRRRCFINLADVYYRAKMYQSAISAYKSALDVIKEELDIESEKISLIYSYAYSLYQLATLNFKLEKIPEGCKYLTHAYKSICSLKKYGGHYEILFNVIQDSMNTYDKNFNDKVIKLENA